MHQNYGISRIVQKLYSVETKNSSYFDFPETVDWIDKTMNVIYYVWLWMHQKYGMSRVLQKLYSVETNNCSYPAVSDNGWLNQRNH